MASLHFSIMSGAAVDKLELDGGLTSLSQQITRVKSAKISKLNLLRRGLERFDDDPNNLEVWKAVQVLKEKADDCGEAFTILTEACLAKMQEELDTWADAECECPMVARHGIAIAELLAYEKDKERLDSNYFRLAGGVHERENSMAAESEAMDVINASLKPEHPKFPPNKVKSKEDAMPAIDKPLKKKKSEDKPEKEKPRRKLPDEAYQMGCWVCGGQHRRDSCQTCFVRCVAKRKTMSLPSAYNSLLTALQLDSQAAGRRLPAQDSLEWWRWRKEEQRRSGPMHKL